MSRSKLKTDAAFHTFDPEIAVQEGINAAVVYRNLVFWVRYNEANRRNFHEGRYWTYNSLAAFDEQFPYRNRVVIVVPQGETITRWSAPSLSDLARYNGRMFRVVRAD